MSEDILSTFNNENETYGTTEQKNDKIPLLFQRHTQQRRNTKNNASMRLEVRKDVKLNLNTTKSFINNSS